MSSFLAKQSSAFKGSLAAAASKISNPKAAAASTAASSSAAATTTSRAPLSPTPSATSDAVNTPSAKRKRDGFAEIYSQPQLTGYGEEVNSQMVFAVDHLKENYRKERGKRKNATDLLNYLSLHRFDDEHKKLLIERLKKNPRVRWRPDAKLTEQTWLSGTFEYAPTIPDVYDATSLIAYLQQKRDASGVKIQDLKDGWLDCEETVGSLERAHKVLVVRTAKDNIPRVVWLDDASLHHSIQAEFKQTWIRTPIPSLDDMHRKLTTAGLKPTSEDPRLTTMNAPAAKKQKKRATNRSGKTTNKHMEKLLMDFSHKRR